MVWTRKDSLNPKPKTLSKLANSRKRLGKVESKRLNTAAKVDQMLSEPIVTPGQIYESAHTTPYWSDVRGQRRGGHR